MSKTHWVAGLFVVLQGLEAVGIVPAGISEWLNAGATLLLTGTVGHRIAKSTGLSTDPKGR